MIRESRSLVCVTWYLGSVGGSMIEYCEKPHHRLPSEYARCHKQRGHRGPCRHRMLGPDAQSIRPDPCSTVLTRAGVDALADDPALCDALYAQAHYASRRRRKR